jgi:hypothetical protein
MADNMGLSLIHEAETSGDGAHDLAVDIVFVHGLNGHPYNTWTAQESGVFWPRDLLPKSLPNFRVLTFGYQSRLADFTASSSFSSVAESLLEKLAQQRGHDQKVSVCPLSHPQLLREFYF